MTNSLAYWANSYVTKKIKRCEYGPRSLRCDMRKKFHRVSYPIKPARICFESEIVVIFLATGGGSEEV
jgi:hypothetical protein